MGGLNLETQWSAIKPIPPFSTRAKNEFLLVLQLEPHFSLCKEVALQALDYILNKICRLQGCGFVAGSCSLG
jgi:hypothetical protein